MGRVCPVGELGPDRDDEVGVLERLHGAHPAVHAEGPHVQRVCGGDYADTHEGGDDRCTDHLGQSLHLVGGTGSDRSSACEDDRFLAFLDQPHGIGYTGDVLPGFFDTEVLVRHRLVYLGVDLVHGKVHMYGPGTSGCGDLPSLVYRVGKSFDIGDAEVMLGDGHHQAVCVHFLEGLGTEDLGTDLSGKCQHRYGISICGGDPGDHVGRSGSGGGKADPGLAGGAGVSVGRMGRALLVSYEYVPDGGVPYLVIYGDHGTSGVAEHRLDISVLEHFEQSS